MIPTSGIQLWLPSLTPQHCLGHLQILFARGLTRKSYHSAVLASGERTMHSLSNRLRSSVPCPRFSCLAFLAGGSSALFEKDDDASYGMLGGFGLEDDGSWYPKDSTSKTFGELSCLLRLELQAVREFSPPWDPCRCAGFLVLWYRCFRGERCRSISSRAPCWSLVPCRACRKWSRT